MKKIFELGTKFPKFSPLTVDELRHLKGGRGGDGDDGNDTSGNDGKGGGNPPPDF